MLRNHVELEKASVARRPPASEEGKMVANAHFFGRRAENFLWGHRDTKLCDQ